MRIALFGARCYPAAHGGIEVAVEQIAAELARMGHQITVFIDRKSVPVAEQINIAVQPSPALRTKYTHTATQIICNVLSMQPRMFDVVHIHGVGPTFPLLLTPRAYRATPTVATVHGIDWAREKWPKPAQAIFRSIAVRALMNVAEVTAVSQSDAESVGSLIGKPVAVIRNGVPVFNNNEPVQRQNYSLYVGRLTPEKNVDGLIREYDRAVADKLGPLYIIGGGGSSHSSRYESDLRQCAPPWVIFEGPKPHVETLERLARAGRFISMSKLEGQPLTVIEALTLGTPLFVSDIPAHREICERSANYVPLGTPGALRHLLLNEPPQRSIVEGAQYDWTWREAASSYLDVYECAIRSFSTARCSQ